MSTILKRPKNSFYDYMIKQIKSQISENKKAKRVVEKESAKIDREYIKLQGQLTKWSDIKSGRSI